ncbi:glycosyltransferase [Acaryochloris sp. CCMEE 5410]|uniref:glycosyltransferase n=1 Tax=Acaryochloris sp. CCMEE 5410 TaxID=310037 RepID=UPI0002483C93|nr:glycosyltransferase [Acaryochloris sp. CCMEE 5410]KAI9131466.1 glycosyltransferase family 1 protein [Acaryochloris sp. CCMEE 5410]
MTKITILTIGSRGDIQPFCALALGLMAKGYSVTLAASFNFADFVQELGIPFAPIAGDFRQLLSTPDGLALLQGNTNVTLIDDQLRWQQYHDAWNACQGSDLLIFAPLAAWGYHLAEALNIPAILVTPIPVTATRSYPFLKFADSSQGKLASYFNVFTFRLVEFLSWQKSRLLMNQFRQEVLQLPPISRMGTRYRRSHPPHLSPLPVLNCYSQAVLPPPSDWPSHVHQGSYLFLDNSTPYTPSPELQAFLQADPKPFYIGFGSMMACNPEIIVDTIVTTLRRTGQRAIFCTGWGGFTTSEVPDFLYVTQEVPHDWLLPQVTAAIHHGGSGTTAATLRAGTPSIVVPFFADQPAWGKRLEQLGVGTAPLPFAELTAETLADRIQTILDTPSMQHKAQDLSRQIQSEDGVAMAIEVIEHYLQ